MTCEGRNLPRQLIARKLISSIAAHAWRASRTGESESTRKSTNARVDGHIPCGQPWFETSANCCGFAQLCPVTRLCIAKTESLGGNAVRKLPSAVIRQLSFPASRLQPAPQLASDIRGGRPRPGGHNRKLPLWSTRKSYV